MSRENVDTMRQRLAAFDRRDRLAWLALTDEDCEVVADALWPDADIVRGREDAWEFYVNVVDAFERRPYADDVDLVYAGPDKVLSHHQFDMRGRASGAEVEFDFWVVATFRDGRAVRDQWFLDRTEALEAVGLAE
jgi:ketosteroid isomerase-like protein